MMISRRDFLKVVGVLAAGIGTGGGCAPLAGHLPIQSSGLSDPVQLSSLDWLALNRISYGPRQTDLLHLADIGLEAYLEEQLSPTAIQDRWTNLLLRRFAVLDMDADQLRNQADKLFDNYDPDLVLNPFRQATLLRQVYSRRQLYEVMVEFWTDHFNISIQKGDCWFLKIVDDREVIRAHALGSFRSLLGASAHSPAMLVYLDNQENHRDAPNENYARELLELHSLGVEGGYSQEDVMALARCLTGWGVKDHFWRGDLTFDPARHSPGSKQVLGTEIQPGGKKEIDQVLDLLAAHPSTARHITTKLARRFLADQTPISIIQKASQVFLESGGNIQAVLRVILLDGLARIRQDPFPLKYKRPVNYIISALRMTGADTDGGLPLQRYLKQMGQPLYEWPTPDGYPDTASAWQGSLLPRWRFALELAQNQLDGTSFSLESLLQGIHKNDPHSFVDRVARGLLGTSLPAAVEIDLLAALQPALEKDPLQAAELVVAGILASPSFQWR